MFADAVDVREELEEALGEFMLMGDKAKEVLEEELLKYEAMQVAHSALTDQSLPTSKLRASVSTFVQTLNIDCCVCFHVLLAPTFSSCVSSCFSV